MRIRIVTPAPPRTRHGNRNTAIRWQRILRDLGHQVRVDQDYQSGACDLLIALHARRSFPSISKFRSQYPQAPLVVALTGTDLYGDLPENEAAQESLRLATRLVALQPLAREALPRSVRRKLHIIFQSVAKPKKRLARRGDRFEVCSIAHLRSVKDPFRVAMAVRQLPSESTIVVDHYGGAMSESMQRRAEQEMVRNDRYRWRGDLPHWKVMQQLTRSSLLVVSSKMEGGPTVVSEALAMGVPAISSDIPGVVGMLGKDYLGYFPVGDTQALRELLLRAERDGAFCQSLVKACRKVSPLVRPSRERSAWRALLSGLSTR